MATSRQCWQTTPAFVMRAKWLRNESNSESKCESCSTLSQGVTAAGPTALALPGLPSPCKGGMGHSAGRFRAGVRRRRGARVGGRGCGNPLACVPVVVNRMD